MKSNATCMRQKGNKFEILFGKLEEKKPLGNPR
jgi:hypothetical protein